MWKVTFLSKKKERGRERTKSDPCRDQTIASTGVNRTRITQERINITVSLPRKCPGGEEGGLKKIREAGSRPCQK